MCIKDLVIDPDSMHNFENVVDFSIDEVTEKDLEDEENEENENSENVDESCGDEDKDESGEDD